MKFPKLLTDSPSYHPAWAVAGMLHHLHRPMGAVPDDPGQEQAHRC